VTTTATGDSVTSVATGDWAPPEAHEHDRLRVEPTLTHGSITAHEPGVAHGHTGIGPFVAPRRGDPADADEYDMSLPPRGPATRQTAPANTDMSLGAMGWLAVLIIAVLLTVLAHAGSVRSHQQEHRGPSLLTDPAYVIAKSAE
jgi:hypothetical protein